jgi:hypothetical protein
VAGLSKGRSDRAKVGFARTLRGRYTMFLRPTSGVFTGA